MMRTILTLILLVFSVTCSIGQIDYYSNADGLAINGYDPVGYFMENKPVQGSEQFSYIWQEVEWHFKDQTNLEAFKLNPEKYSPQFGGYCAYGTSENHKSPTEPSAFTIVNDKLYLNYNQKVKQLWVKDMNAHIVKAEANWVTLKDKTK